MLSILFYFTTGTASWEPEDSDVLSVNDIFRDQIIQYASRIRRGFAAVKRTTSEACSLISADALLAFIEIARWIIYVNINKKFNQMALFNTFISRGLLSEGVDLNVYKMKMSLCEKFKQKSDWPPPSDMGVGETRIPDVLTELCSEDIHGQERTKIVIIGEVKSSAEVRSSTTEADMFHQAWRQALLGLVHSDITYGILFQPQKCELFELKVTKTSKGGSQLLRATTLKETFSFEDNDGPTFNTDSVLSVLKKIIAIFLELPHL